MLAPAAVGTPISPVRPQATAPVCLLPIPLHAPPTSATTIASLATAIRTHTALVATPVLISLETDVSVYPMATKRDVRRWSAIALAIRVRTILN